MKQEGIPGKDLVVRNDRKMGQSGFLEPDCEVLCLASDLTSPGLNFVTKAS